VFLCDGSILSIAYTEYEAAKEGLPMANMARRLVEEWVAKRHAGASSRVHDHRDGATDNVAGTGLLYPLPDVISGRLSRLLRRRERVGTTVAERH
jgi:hypothetical protein